jgi:hypothetical protein
VGRDETTGGRTEKGDEGEEAPGVARVIALKLPPVQKHPLETCSHSSRRPRLVPPSRPSVPLRSRSVTSRLGFPAICSREDPRVMREGRRRHLKTDL